MSVMLRLASTGLLLLTPLCQAAQLRNGRETRLAQLKLLFNETGYQTIVAKKSNAVMADYVRHVVGYLGGIIKNEAAFEGVIPFYSGVKASQSYSQLVQELGDVAWVDWSKAKLGFREDLMSLLAQRYDGRFDQLDQLAKTTAALGAIASLDEVGYHSVADLRCDAQMEMFMRRVIAAHGGSVSNEGDLRGLVPFYSGTAVTQTHGSLVDELSQVPWIKGFTRSLSKDVSSVASLDNSGYQSVLKAKSPRQLELYVRRVIAARNATVKSEDSLHKILSLYSVSAPRSYGDLMGELSSASWLEFFSSEQLRKRSSSRLSLRQIVKARSIGFNEGGYQAVAALRSNGEMGSFIRRLLKTYGAKVVDYPAFRKLVPYHSGMRETRSFARLRDDLRAAAFVQWSSQEGNATSELAQHNASAATEQQAAADVAAFQNATAATTNLNADAASAK